MARKVERYGHNKKRVQELLERTNGSCDALDVETERAGPLIAAGWLDDHLELLLRNKFVDEGLEVVNQDRLLNGMSAPLASFAVRISICRAFGLLSHEVCDLLDALREIRNHCGHSQRAVSLTDKQILPRVREIREFVAARYTPDVREHLTNDKLVIQAAVVALIREIKSGNE